MRKFPPAKQPLFDLARELTTAGARRWSARRKAAVVLAVRSRVLGRGEAYDRCMLSEEELSQWEKAFNRDGIAGLQVKNIAGRVSSCRPQRCR